MAIEITIPDGPILDVLTDIFQKEKARRIASLERELLKTDDPAQRIQIEAAIAEAQAMTGKQWIISQMRQWFQRLDLEATRNEATNAARNTVAQAVVDRGQEIRALDNLT